MNSPNSVGLSVGSEAPDFLLRDQNNQEVRLSDFRGRRNVVIVFYPYAFTGTCRGELRAIQDNLDDFVNETTQVLTISVDSVFAHKVWAEREGYEFPLLADFWPHGEVARAYGVFNEEKGTSYRGTFIVDVAGVVRFAEVSLVGARDQGNWRDGLAAL